MKTLPGRPARFASLSALAVLALGGVGDAQSYALNPPLAGGEEEGTRESILDLRLAPDGSCVVYTNRYRASQEWRTELCSVQADGSQAAVKLMEVASFTNSIHFSSLFFAISPDSRHVVYRVGEVPRSTLFSVPIDGSRAPTPLTGPPHAAGLPGPVFDFVISGDRVVYVSDQDGDRVFQLYSVPIDAAQPPVRLNSPPVLGGAVRRALITPDSSRVIYLATQDVYDLHELYSVPIDGSLAPTKLNGAHAPVSDNSTRRGFAITPDGSRVVFRAANELYAVAPTGGTPSLLNGPLAPGGTVSDLAVTADSARVVYAASQEASDVVELFSVPLDQSSPPLKLNAPLVAGGNVGRYWLSPNSLRAVYVADQDSDEVFELYSAVLDASQAPVKLNGSLVAGGNVNWARVSPDNTTVMFRADHQVDQRFELHAAPLDGSAAPVRLNDTLVPGGRVWASWFSPDSSRVVYVANQDALSSQELYSVPSDRSQAPVKLSRPPAPRVEVREDFQISPDSTLVVYREHFRGVHVAPIDGGTPDLRLDRMGLPPGQVRQYEVTASGDVFYLAHKDTDGMTELYHTSLAGGGACTKLNAALIPEGDVTSYELTPDAGWIVYRADQEQDQTFEFYGAPTDGSVPPVKLNGPLVSGGDVGAGLISAALACFVYSADEATDHVVELYSAPLDGSSPRIKLSGALAGSVVGLPDGGFALSPDGMRLVYMADQDHLGKVELYSIPADGSAAGIRLNPAMANNRDVEAFSIDLQSSRVLYIADQDDPNRNELYSVPIDGGSDPVKLNPQGFSVRANAGALGFTPDGTRVVFITDGELWIAPIDGSQPALKLAGTLAHFLGDVVEGSLRITPDSSRVVYMADRPTGIKTGLYSVRTNGNQTRVVLNGMLPDGAKGLRGFLITPDGSRAVYQADQDELDVIELYSVPADGSQAPAKINGPMAGDVGIGVLHTLGLDGTQIDADQKFAISADSRRVVYRADQDTFDKIEIYVAPVDGSHPPTRLNPDLLEGGDVIDLTISPDGSRVLYRAYTDRYAPTDLLAAYFEPEVSALTPASGRASGGNRIAVLGTGFTQETEVFFGGVPSRQVTWIGATRLRVVVPARPTLSQPRPGAIVGRLRRAPIAPETVDVTVSVGETSSTLPAAYTYVPGP